MEESQVRVLIEKDLDIIRPDCIVTADNKVIMFIENQDGVERIINGWSLAVYIDNQELPQCIRCKNGKTGWAEFLDENLNLKKVKGNIKVYLCIPFNKGKKPPRIDIHVSDIKLDTQDIRES